MDDTSIERARTQINTAALLDSADAAIALLMEHAEIKSGDVAGVFFSEIEDLDVHWHSLDQHERATLLSSYLDTERVYLPL